MAKPEDLKLDLLIRFIDIQLLQLKAISEKFAVEGKISDYGNGCIDTYELILSAALNIKNEFSEYTKEVQTFAKFVEGTKNDE